ncbi:MAG TPA: response regulator [Roseiflexaceae bacterium]|nr:response regulator [Roseiflexaceae bacterium]
MSDTSTPHHQTVLVVDDEEAIRAILMRLLVHMGYSVLAASDGQSALEMVRSNAIQIDCVMLDVAMPGMSGVDAARAIHEVASQVPLVIMSGHAMPWLTARELDVPVAGFLQKPFAYEDLRRTLSGVFTPHERHAT